MKNEKEKAAEGMKIIFGIMALVVILIILIQIGSARVQRVTGYDNVYVIDSSNRIVNDNAQTREVQKSSDNLIYSLFKKIGMAIMSLGKGINGFVVQQFLSESPQSKDLLPFGGNIPPELLIQENNPGNEIAKEVGNLGIVYSAGNTAEAESATANLLDSLNNQNTDGGGEAGCTQILVCADENDPNTCQPRCA